MFISAKTLMAFLTGVGLTYGAIFLLNDQPLQLSVNTPQLIQKIRQVLGFTAGANSLKQERVESFALSDSAMTDRNNGTISVEPIAEFTALLNQEAYEQVLAFYEQQLKAGMEHAYFKLIYQHLLERLP